MTREPRTLCDVLLSRASERPTDVGYVYRGGDGTGAEDRTLTYGGLDREARLIAAEIRSHCRAGDRAILLYPPGPEFIAGFFGCLYAGIIAVPAYPPRVNRGLGRLQAIAGDCQPALVLSPAEIGDAIQAQSAEVASFRDVRWIATDRIEAARQATWEPLSLDEESLAFLQYTSGSTGTPKGVMISHGNLMHNSRCIRERWQHSERSVGVSWLPQFHDMGLVCGLLQPLYAGFKAVLLSPASFVQQPYRWLDTISRYGGTTTCAPNFAFDLCVRKVTPEQRETLNLGCLETVINGAEPVLLETITSFTQAFAPCGFKASAFRGGYGLAEGTVFVTSCHRRAEGPHVRRLSRSAIEQHQVVDARAAGTDAQDFVSCGPPADDQELVIVKPDQHTRCGPEQIGEIWVRGASVARGYWQRPEETASTFGAVLDDTKRGSFLRTGDLGFLHEDELYVTGRLKDLIIVRGRNHYPQDIERTVEKVHASLRPSCTAAFSLNDVGEERAVVVQEIRRHHRDVDLERLLGDIFEAVADEHELSLHAVVLIREGDISKTSSGKIQRTACKQRYRAGQLNVVREATFGVSPKQGEPGGAGFLKRLYELDAEECRTQVQSYLVQAVRAVRPQSFYVEVHHSLMRIGLDSLVAADLRSAIEHDLGIAISHATLMETSIGELSEEIIRQLTSQERDRPGSDVAGRVAAMSDADVNALLDDMLSTAGRQDG